MGLVIMRKVILLTCHVFKLIMHEAISAKQLKNGKY